MITVKLNALQAVNAEQCSKCKQYYSQDAYYECPNTGCHVESLFRRTKGYQPLSTCLRCNVTVNTNFEGEHLAMHNSQDELSNRKRVGEFTKVWGSVPGVGDIVVCLSCFALVRFADTNCHARWHKGVQAC